jgi:drug/metabolite transporter (DMT)-like permease
MKAWVSLAFVAIFPSVCAILLWNSAIARIGPSRAGFYMYLTPVYAAIFAIPLLGEAIGIFHIVGAILIIIGVTMSSQKT